MPCVIFHFLDIDEDFSPQFEVARNEGEADSVKPLSAETKELLLEAYSSDLHTLFDLTGIAF